MASLADCANCSQKMAPVKAKKCKICPREFTDWPTLDIHYMLKHMGHDTKCGECGQRTGEGLILQEHIRQKHANFNEKSKSTEFRYDDGKGVKCRECDFHSKTASVMKKHVADEHETTEFRPGIFKYRCEDCNERFSDYDIMRNHKENVHGIKGIFNCDVCADGFDSLKTLQEHKSVEHEGKKIG